MCCTCWLYWYLYCQCYWWAAWMHLISVWSSSHSVSHLLIALTGLWHAHYTITHSLTSVTHAFTLSLIHSLTHSPTHSLTYSPTHSLTHSLTHLFTHSLILTHSVGGKLVRHSLPNSYPLNSLKLLHTDKWVLVSYTHTSIQYLVSKILVQCKFSIEMAK